MIIIMVINNNLNINVVLSCLITPVITNNIGMNNNPVINILIVEATQLTVFIIIYILIPKCIIFVIVITNTANHELSTFLIILINHQSFIYILTL